MIGLILRWMLAIVIAFFYRETCFQTETPRHSGLADCRNAAGALRLSADTG